MKKTVWTPEMNERLLKLKDEGLTSAEIAESLGVDVTAVRNKFRYLKPGGANVAETKAACPAVQPAAAKAEPLPQKSDAAKRLLLISDVLCRLFDEKDSPEKQESVVEVIRAIVKE